MSKRKNGLKVIALLEASKGLVSLVVGLGIHKLAGTNVQKFLESFLEHLHLNPANRLPGIILHESNLLTSFNLTLIAMGAVVYSVVRLVEAYGLWHALTWTEWFALLSGAVYIPFEIYEVVVHPGTINILALTINVAVVWYMYTVVRGTSESIRKSAADQEEPRTRVS